MRTILRAYHSVPSLQKTPIARKGMQDAPRMKNNLKAIKLDTEESYLPTTLAELYDLQDQGQRPTTSVTNMILILSLTTDPFPGKNLDILNLFMNCNIPSNNRANLFLFTIYHFLESRYDDNPFAKPPAPGLALPPIKKLSDEKYAALGENVDEEEELRWGNEMRQQRIRFLQSLPQPSARADEPKAEVSANGKDFPLRRGRGPGKKNLQSKEGTPVGSEAGGKKRKRHTNVGPISASSTPHTNGTETLPNLNTNATPGVDTSLDGIHLWNFNNSIDDHIPSPPLSPVTDARMARFPKWVQDANWDLDGFDYWGLKKLIDQVEDEMGPPQPKQEVRFSDFWPPPPQPSLREEVTGEWFAPMFLFVLTSPSLVPSAAE